MILSRVGIERAAIAIGLLAGVVGILTPVLAKNDAGVRLDVSDGRVVVAYVDPFSPSAQYGVEAGMVALSVNDRELIRMPQETYPFKEPSPDPVTGEVLELTPNPATGEYPAPVLVWDPAAPTPVVLGDDALQALVDAPLTQLWAVRPGDLAAWTPDTGGYTASIGDDGRNSLRDSLLLVVFGIAVLFATAWWLTTGRAGASLRDLGLPLAVATAAPFLLQPLGHLWSPVAVATLGALMPMSMLPLASALVARIEDPQDRGVALAAIATCAIGAAVVGGARAVNPSWFGLDVATWWLTVGIAAIPGLIAAGPALPGALRVAVPEGIEATASGRLLRSTELAIAGVTPAVALATASSSYLFLFLLWIAAIGLAGRFTVRPLVRLASRAQLQRDLIVAATEAERARVAADIHDDALQELTLLVRRLDAAGDTEGADIARTVSDRLRAICGDLRLPILDDLGVGPALDWLVLRIERLAGGEVRLERADGTRPPPDVELAFFRVAQEALANAVKHGKPPIVVRYRSTDGAASLSIDDAGSGITPDAGERAEREGHFGLLNMQQRAEGIGAILDVRRWPTGGTHVQLEWRTR
ncbi:MAG: sensor histidine kinase [Candidatus Limnocylindrales bacterium]